MIKPEKTRTNAVDDREIAEIISFCGALISPRTLETRPDFGSYFGRNIAFASKLNPRDGDALEDFMEKRLNFLVTVNLDRLYQGLYSIHTGFLQGYITMNCLLRCWEGHLLG